MTGVRMHGSMAFVVICGSLLVQNVVQAELWRLGGYNLLPTRRKTKLSSLEFTIPSLQEILSDSLPSSSSSSLPLPSIERNGNAVEEGLVTGNSTITSDSDDTQKGLWKFLPAPKENLKRRSNRDYKNPKTKSSSIDPMVALKTAFRMLLPVIVARRLITEFGVLVYDWYTGRTLRHTYRRIEDNYWRVYQIPAAIRSAGRFLAQWLLLTVLGRIMEDWVGLSHAPCLDAASGGCYWWCSMLWIVAVVGMGHAGAAAMAVWGGPLRIQLLPSESLQRPSARRVFAQGPRNVLRWLRDPDQWIREIANAQRRNAPIQLKPFHPDPLIFPVTWEPLRIVQMMTVAKEMALNKDMMHSIMRQILIQQAVGDEWYRVLLCEKRVGLGIVVSIGYFFSTLSLYLTAARASLLSGLLLLPSVLA